MPNTLLSCRPGVLTPAEEKIFRNIAMSMDIDTTNPGVKELYRTLVENVGTFGCCAPATILFIAAMAATGDTGWGLKLVEDGEFPPGHALRTHWVAEHRDGRRLDLTVGDEEKEVRAFGSMAERQEVTKQLRLIELKAVGNLEGRVQAALDRYNQHSKHPLRTTASQLIERAYRPILSNTVTTKPQLVKVTPVARLG